jgi:hypothetical protein
VITYNSRNKLPYVALALVGVCGLGLVYWLLASGPEQETASLPPQAPTQSLGTAPSAQLSTSKPSAAASAGEEIIDIDPARYFDIGYSGGLVVDESLRAKLDAVVTSLPENPTPADLAKLEFQLRQGLPKEDAEKAIKLVHAYRSYSKDMRAEMMRGNIPQTQEQAQELVATMVAIQRRNFDEATVQTMFGQQNALSRVTLQASIVTQDPALSYADKKARLDALRAQLPADRRELIPELPAVPDSPKGP